jgi:hypothetical protein
MVCPESGLFLLLSSDYAFFCIIDFVLELNPFLYHCYQCIFSPFDGLFFSLCVGSTLQESIEKYKMELPGYDIGISHSVHPMKEEGASCVWQ